MLHHNLNECIHKKLLNTIFTNALKTSCGISSNDLKSDIHLQNLLRVKLCEYFCENGIVKDKSSNHIYLKEEYSK